MDSNKFKKYALYLAVIPASLMLLSSPASAYYHKKAIVSPYYERTPCVVEPPCPCPNRLHDGWYEGFNIGYDSYRIRRSSNITFGGVTVTSRPIENPAGIVGGLVGGYGYQFPWMYLGVEGFANLSGASNSATIASVAGVASYSGSLNVRANYGASLLPGVMISDSTLFYVRIGYNWARLSGSETLAVAGFPPLTSNASKTVSGLNYGVGIESEIYRNFSLRGDYNHTSFNSFTSTVGTKYTASNNQFLLGVIYHFC